MNEVEEMTPIPFPTNYRNREDYASLVQKQRTGKPLSEFGMKVVVTDFGMAHWFA